MPLNKETQTQTSIDLIKENDFYIKTKGQKQTIS